MKVTQAHCAICRKRIAEEIAKTEGGKRAKEKADQRWMHCMANEIKKTGEKGKEVSSPHAEEGQPKRPRKQRLPKTTGHQTQKTTSGDQTIRQKRQTHTHSGTVQRKQGRQA